MQQFPLTICAIAMTIAILDHSDETSTPIAMLEFSDEKESKINLTINNNLYLGLDLPPI